MILVDLTLSLCDEIDEQIRIMKGIIADLQKTMGIKSEVDDGKSE